MLAVYRAFHKTFSEKWQMVLVLVILLGANKGFGQEAMDVELSSQFHESESQVVTKNQWVLEAFQEKLQIVVLERDFGEPVTEPLKILVGYKVLDEDFRRLTPEGERVMEKSFCGVEAPMIVERDAFLNEHGIDPVSLQEGQAFSEAGHYLVIYVRKYDDQLGACQTQPESVEAYWLDGLLP